MSIQIQQKQVRVFSEQIFALILYVGLIGWSQILAGRIFHRMKRQGIDEALGYLAGIKRTGRPQISPPKKPEETVSLDTAL
ncbi:hypothetical protein N7451_012702 [Penicillium sp. IBT 35674x]|nr:hypothetical protein N7451_012702 [Penicillium sp. IBT 35674x]